MILIPFLLCNRKFWLSWLVDDRHLVYIKNWKKKRRKKVVVGMVDSWLC
jgi:hypothetical protein